MLHALLFTLHNTRRQSYSQYIVGWWGGLSCSQYIAGWWDGLSCSQYIAGWWGGLSCSQYIAGWWDGLSCSRYIAGWWGGLSCSQYIPGWWNACDLYNYIDFERNHCLFMICVTGEVVNRVYISLCYQLIGVLSASFHAQLLQKVKAAYYSNENNHTKITNWL